MGREEGGRERETEIEGGCPAHAPGICCQAAGSGCGLRRAGQGREREL